MATEEKQEESKFLDWPEVPKKYRPKNLYVNHNLTSLERSTLDAKGWVVVDTRVLPTNTASEHLEAIKAVLEGIRVRSIEPDKDLKDFINQEMFIVGVKGKGAQTSKKTSLGGESLDNLINLDFERTGTVFTNTLKNLEIKTGPKRKKKNSVS